MSASPVQIAPTKAALPRQQMVLQGKVVRGRKYGQHYLTVIIAPALDAYSKPDFFEVRSARRFAERDEEGSWVVRAGGYEGKAFRTADKDSGEQVMVTPINTYFDLVE